jgi:hypothetical protein
MIKNRILFAHLQNMIRLIYSYILNLNLSRCNSSGAECNVPFSALKSYSVLVLFVFVRFLISTAVYGTV